jgi:hypothetical protein
MEEIGEIVLHHRVPMICRLRGPAMHELANTLALSIPKLGL